MLEGREAVVQKMSYYPGGSVLMRQEVSCMSKDHIIRVFFQDKARYELYVNRVSNVPN